MLRNVLFMMVAMAICSVAVAEEKGKLSKGEQVFLKQAAINNLMEIRSGEIAQRQAQDPQVKQIAEQMVRDHQAANDQLKELAKKKGVDLPSELSRLHEESLEALKECQGKEFDQAYMSMQKAAHLKAASKFQDKAQLAKDEDVKQFAASQAPILEQHAQHVISVASAQGLPMPNFGEAQPAAARIGADPSTPGAGQQNRDTAGTEQRDQGQQRNQDQ